MRFPDTSHTVRVMDCASRTRYAILLEALKGLGKLPMRVTGGGCGTGSAQAHLEGAGGAGGAGAGGNLTDAVVHHLAGHAGIRVGHGAPVFGGGAGGRAEAIEAGERPSVARAFHPKRSVLRRVGGPPERYGLPIGLGLQALQRGVHGKAAGHAPCARRPVERVGQGGIVEREPQQTVGACALGERAVFLLTEHRRGACARPQPHLIEAAAEEARGVRGRRRGRTTTAEGEMRGWGLNARKRL